MYKTKKNPLTLSCIESRIETNQLWYGKFQLGLFDIGQGLTVANSLRRTLLSELSGLRIIAVEIEGALHEYSNLSGVTESVLDILLNLKKIIFTSRFQYQQPQFGFLQYKGPGIVRAADLKLPISIQIVNPDQYIATLSYDGFLNIKFFIFQGYNYLQFSDINNEFQKINNVKKKILHVTKNINLLLIDTIFIPIVKVNYLLEKDNFSPYIKNKERIILEIWTNGSIHPRQAIHYSIKKLIQLLIPFQETNLVKSLIFYSFSNSSLNLKNKKRIEMLDIGNLDLSLRSYSCLKKANINTIGELIQFSSNQLLLLKNFGKRSLEEVQFRLNQIGFYLKKN